jgi:replicative DNA helicase
MTAVLEEEEAPAGASVPAFEFDEDFQAKIIALKLRDTAFNERTDGLLQPQYFASEAHGHLVRLVDDYYAKYRKAPDAAIHKTLVIQAVKEKRLRRDAAEDVLVAINAARKADISDRSFVVDQVADFARNQAVEQAILESVHLLAKKDFSKIVAMIQAATNVGAAEETGEYDYWEGIERRTQERLDEIAGKRLRDGITTGIKELDQFLYHHGWGRKELSVLMGAAKAGKSMSLGGFAKFASLAGKNVLYVTLEVAAKIIEERIDADVSDTAIRALKTTPHEVDKRIKARRDAGGIGHFKIREYASNTFKASQLRRLLESYRAKGIQFDAVFVDYADIMAPERFSGDLKEDSRQIYLDLRAIAFDYNVALITATQTNRDGAKKMTAGMTDVAEDFNKIRTADIVISINATEAERAAGEARLFFAASRNSEDGFTLRIRQDRSKMKFITKILGKE